MRVSLYQYGGLLNEEHLIKDEKIDVKSFVAFLRSLNTTKMDDEAGKLVFELLSKADREGQADKNFKDKIVFASNMLMVKYPDALTGEPTKWDWFVVWNYLNDFYDINKLRIDRYDDLIRLYSLHLGLFFNPDEVSAAEALEIMKTEIDDNTGERNWRAVVPKFVIDSFLNNDVALAPFEEQIKMFKLRVAIKELAEYLNNPLKDQPDRDVYIDLFVNRLEEQPELEIIETITNIYMNDSLPNEEQLEEIAPYLPTILYEDIKARISGMPIMEEDIEEEIKEVKPKPVTAPVKKEKSEVVLKLEQEIEDLKEIIDIEQDDVIKAKLLKEIEDLKEIIEIS